MSSTIMANTTVTAHVHNGKVVLDAPSDFPEGAAVTVHLELADPGDALDDYEPEERARLEAAIEEAEEDIDRGDYVDALEYVRNLAAKREAASR